MDYQKKREQLELLERKMAEMESRPLNSAEKDVYDEMVKVAREIRMELPEPSLTMPHQNYSIMNRGRSGSRASSTGPFKSFAEQVQAIVRAGSPGGQTDPRLFNVRAAASGLGESIGSDGGFLVQSDFSTSLLQAGYDAGLVAGRCNRIQISANANGIKLPAVDETSRATGSRWGGIRSYWTEEAGLKVASQPKFRLMELTLHKLIGLCYVTDELLQDAMALETFLRQAFRDEIAFALDDAIVNGSGAGMPLGILNSGALVTVDKEVGQGKTVILENIAQMFSRMPARNRRSAIWYVNQEVEPQLFTMSLSVGTGGGPVYLPAGGVSAAPYGTLFGRPVIPIEQAPALGDLGDISFVDPQSYILIDKGGVQTDVSIHIRFEYDESTLRFVFRTDGMPMYASPITPYKGANDLSPFVALGPR